MVACENTLPQSVPMVACENTLLQSVPMVACENTLSQSVPMVEDKNVFQDIFSSSDMMIQESKYDNFKFDGLSLDDLFEHIE